MIERLRRVLGASHHAHPLRRGIWRVMARVGATGMHSLPVSRRWVDIRRVRMEMRGLAAEMEGFRLVQLSDLHYSPVVWRRYIEQYLDFVNAIRPDLVVITGDLITGGYRYAKGVAKVLKRLETPYGAAGVVVTFGNHDYSMWGKRSAVQAGKRGDFLEKVIEDEGITVLRNEVLRVSRSGVRQEGGKREKGRHGGEGNAGTEARGRSDDRPRHGGTEGGELVLVGLDDEWTGKIDAEYAFSLVERDAGGLGGGVGGVVCLNHNPVNAMELVGYPWQWMLSGHTHGRQIGDKGIGKRLLAHKFRRFTHGLYELGEGKKLYVNRGLSYGQRIHDWCRPEVTVFRVGRGEGESDKETE